MPKKSRRVAVRQAELGQRKRRSHRPGGAPAAAHSHAAQVIAPTVESPEPTTATPEADAAPQTTAAPAPDMPRSVPQPAAAPASASRPAAPYMMPELRRIGMIAALMLVILAVLTVALR